MNTPPMLPHPFRLRFLRVFTWLILSGFGATWLVADPSGVGGERAAMFQHVETYLLWPEEEVREQTVISNGLPYGYSVRRMVEVVENFPRRKILDRESLREFLSGQPAGLTVLLVSSIRWWMEPEIPLSNRERVSVDELAVWAEEFGIALMVVPIPFRESVARGGRIESAAEVMLEAMGDEERWVGEIGMVRDPDKLRWYPAPNDFVEIPGFRRWLVYRPEGEGYRVNQLEFTWSHQWTMEERWGREVLRSEQQASYPRAEDLLTRMQNHIRFALPVEVDFRGFMERSWAEETRQPEDVEWIARLEVSKPDWPVFEGRSDGRRFGSELEPARVLPSQSVGNFFNDWFLGNTYGLSRQAAFYPALNSLRLAVADHLERNGRAEELPAVLVAVNAAWRVICGIPLAEDPSIATIVETIPEPFASYLLVLAEGRMDLWSKPVLDRFLGVLEHPDVTPSMALVAGLIFLDYEDTRAQTYFDRVNALASDLTPDWDHAGLQANGWLGRIALRQGDSVKALRLYRENSLAGMRDLESYTLALRRLAVQMEEIHRTGERPGWLSDPILQRDLTLWVLRENRYTAGGRNADFRRAWAPLVLDQPDLDPTLAPVWLLLADREGMSEHREHWMERLDPAHPYSYQLAAQLSLRAGDLDSWRRARRELIHREWRDETDWNLFFVGHNDLWTTAVRDYGLSLLLEGEYATALPYLVTSNWFTAVLLAERILTFEELQACMGSLDSFGQMASGLGRPSLSSLEGEETFLDRRRRLMYEVLAARAVREDRWEVAMEWYQKAAPDGDSLEVGQISELIRLRSESEAPGLSDRDRAEALFRLARTLRRMGWSIASTRHRNNSHLLDSNYIYAQDRSSIYSVSPHPLPSSAPERLAESAETNHSHGRTYRYLAAEFAWRAAELLPDNEDRTAEILWHGGVWLKYIDPPAADRFYKALATRCVQTELGARARNQRWFPRSLEP